LRRWRQRKDGAEQLTPAGVLFPIIQRPLALHVLFTRRASAMKHHAGQVSFPGGRAEPGDADVLATALRETEEEIGVAPDKVRVVGALEPIPTITGYAVTPVIGFVAADVRLRLEPAEVERAFEVPLDFLLDEANVHRSSRRIEGVSVPLHEYGYGGERIWGVTAAMIIDFMSIINSENQ